MPPIETVKVKNGSGFAIINKSDYDPDKMTLYKDGNAEPKSKTAPKKKSVK